MANRTVSIRELNQRTGRVVRAVADQGPVAVTDHGREIALLVPIPEELDPWKRLLKRGAVEPADPEPDLPLPTHQARKSSGEILDELRADR